MASSTHESAAVLVRDDQSCLPLSRDLRDGDLIVLLSPVVAPIPESSTTTAGDPFEPLGRALSRHHSWVRHVPYTPRGGITSTHVAFVKRAAAIVFVVSGVPWRDQPSQLELGELVHSVAGSQSPVITIICLDPTPIEADFPTTINISSLSRVSLEAAADLVFQATPQLARPGPNLQDLVSNPKIWPVEAWDSQRDSTATYELWHRCLPEKFYLPHQTLLSILVRDGYSRHYVVREPETGSVLGFCATYTTYIDGGGERLVGSLSAIIVEPSSRRQGIGLSLHDHALRQLTKTRGVSRLQLGSTFPRLLYGLPTGIESEGWFRRRAWPIDEQGPDSAQNTRDCLLDFDRWPSARESQLPTLHFRPCDPAEFDAVLKLVEDENSRGNRMGWYDQYVKLAKTVHVRDIIVGVEKDTIIAAALTYASNYGSPVADDLPWAATISPDIGGVACICIQGRHGGKRNILI